MFHNLYKTETAHAAEPWKDPVQGSDFIVDVVDMVDLKAQKVYA